MMQSDKVYNLCQEQSREEGHRTYVPGCWWHGRVLVFVPASVQEERGMDTISMP